MKNYQKCLILNPGLFKGHIQHLMVLVPILHLLQILPDEIFDDDNAYITAG